MGAAISVSPPWLAVMARSKRVCRACDHGMTIIPSRSSSSESPWWKGSEPFHENTTCTRGSLSNTATASSSRVAAVTLCATAST